MRALGMEDGYWPLGRWSGAPIRLHWTFPLLAVYICGLRPAAWVGFFILIVIHELGHAVLVRWCGHGVVSIDVSGIGGLCRWAGAANTIERSLIAWGGVWAQGLLYLATTLAIGFFGAPESIYLQQIVSIFLHTSVWLMVFNLLPLPPLDGAEAWKLFPALWRQARYERASGREVHARQSEVAPPDTVTPPPPMVPPIDQVASSGPEAPASAQDQLFNRILNDVFRGKVPPEMREEGSKPARIVPRDAEDEER